MLKKFLNVIIILVIIIAISAVFINLYNNSKLESNNFKTSTEEVTNKNLVKDKEQNEEGQNNENESSEQEEIDNNENNSEVSENEESTNNIEGNEIAVASTSSFKNVYFQVLGSVVLVLGIGAIIIKTKKV